jgi:probable rRNA maturation factor
MDNDIFIQIPAAYSKKISRNIILGSVIDTLKENQKSKCGLSVVLVSDERIRRLNKEYRGYDAITDVLSFSSDLSEIENPDQENEIQYLGDIIISFPQASRQADQGNHSVGSEIALLTIHGVLHLLGFDHDTQASKQRMWFLQNMLLDKLGFSEAKVQ